ncbi:helix-turn-helix domain-containing protein [Corynebacterium poyangense]|nr:helix-turn-helix domain-containing protein [Corynebacterium poyangense]
MLSDWENLVKSIENRNEEFADAFLAKFLQRRPYGEKTIPDSEAHATARMIFDALVELLRADPNQGRSPTNSRNIKDQLEKFGRLRARKGISIEAVVETMRLDFAVIWHMLEAQAKGPQREVLLSQAVRVNQAVDTLSSQVRDAYLRERAEMDNDSRIATINYLQRLINPQELNEEEYLEISKGLGIGNVEGVDALITSPRYSGLIEKTVLKSLMVGDVMGVRIQDCYCLLSPSKNDYFSKIVSKVPRETVSILYPLRKGLAEVHTALRGAPDLLRQLELLSGMHYEFPLHIDSAVDLVVGSYIYQVIPGLVDEKVKVLMGIRARERHNIVEAVETYLSTGSVKAVASQLYCHRNTVMNRLKSFADYTDISPLKPKNYALIIGVLARLHDEELSL